MTPRKIDKCEGCGYVPEHMCLLAAVYIDGCIDGNDPSNYRMLCAICQRMEAAMLVELISPAEAAEQRQLMRQQKDFN